MKRERENEKHAPRDEASSRSSLIPSDIFSRACAAKRARERRYLKKKTDLSFQN
jgi:hypothetical protein